jgi:DNA-binding NtrC family response regulator
VRELRNVVLRAAVFATDSVIGVEDLPDEFSNRTFAADLQNFAVLPGLERQAILAALEENRGHQQKAAEKLGISKRTLQRKIKSYGMASEQVSVLE